MFTKHFWLVEVQPLVSWLSAICWLRSWYYFLLWIFCALGYQAPFKSTTSSFANPILFANCVKTATFWERSWLFPSIPFLKIEILSRGLIFQNLVGSSSPQQKGVGMHTASLKTGTSENVLLVFIFPYDQKTTTRQKSCTINVFC